MRVLGVIVATSIAVTPVMATPISPFARETAVWNAVKSKQMAVFEASMTSGFVGVYAWGTHDREQELRVVRNQTLRSFSISNFRTHMVDADNMLTTYTVDVAGTADKKSFSGRYWNTTLWHRSAGKWLTAYHGEASAK